MREKKRFSHILRGIQSIHKTSDPCEDLPCFEYEQLISTAEDGSQILPDSSVIGASVQFLRSAILYFIFLLFCIIFWTPVYLVTPLPANWRSITDTSGLHYHRNLSSVS